MRKLSKIFIISFIFFTISCSSSESNIVEIKERYSLKNEKYEAEVISTTILKKEDKQKFKVSNLFDLNPKTVWFLQAGYKGDLKFIFKYPVYIKKITLKTIINSTQFSGYRIKEEKIKLSNYKDNDSVFSDGFYYDFQNNQNLQEINYANNLMCSILKTKILTITIDDNFSKDFEGIFIGDIFLEITEKPFFKPTLSINEIRKRYVKDDNKPWQLRSPGNKYSSKQLAMIEKEEEEILANLIFYGINGDKLAEKILYNYSPAEAINGEYFSFLREWYEMEKKNK